MPAIVVNKTALVNGPELVLSICKDGIAVFPRHPVYGWASGGSLAAWYRVAATWTGDDVVNGTIFHARGGFPVGVAAMIDGVLRLGNPVEPLMDWLIEHGPAPLAAAVETLQRSLLTKSEG